MNLRFPVGSRVETLANLPFYKVGDADPSTLPAGSMGTVTDTSNPRYLYVRLDAVPGAEYGLPLWALTRTAAPEKVAA